MKEPKIRIKGFSGEWKRPLLEECLEISNEVNNQNLYGKNEVLSVSDESGVVNQIKHLGRSYAGKSLSGYKILRPDQIVYTKSPLRQKPFGIIKVNNGETGIVSVLYGIYDAKEGVYPKYIQRYFDPSNRINNYLLPLVNKGAKNTMNISDETALQGTISIPPTQDEQKAICNVLDGIDAQILASTSRLASLKQMKAASLQAMFPQEGETVPKVRFKEFKGEWDKQSASDLFLSIDERNRPELPVLSACQDIRGMIPREKIGFNVSHDTSNEVTYKRVKPGQFVIHLRSFQGGFAHSSYDGIISPAYTVFDFKDKERHDDYYWKIVFMSRAFIDRLRLITYGIRDGRSINFDEFKNLLFLFPSKEEQHAIATFFRSLDRQIALHTQRLEKLKQIKAACLDKMFV
ncbi:restriction endonuclease subunit S [uncultured Prevotellamassilia sp.]|uniref:restriction endonuclease subunit S n=1 Tax=uncultured Prevotellamassilia sp. TaxID=1926676 RepID=UPI00259004DD|nr:restriction endonuclease subunit S [uncultured Prevotellamassilia sp.]